VIWCAALSLPIWKRITARSVPRHMKVLFLIDFELISCVCTLFVMCDVIYDPFCDRIWSDMMFLYDILWCQMWCFYVFSSNCPRITPATVLKQPGMIYMMCFLCVILGWNLGQIFKKMKSKTDFPACFWCKIFKKTFFCPFFGVCFMMCFLWYLWCCDVVYDALWCVCDVYDPFYDVLWCVLCQGREVAHKFFQVEFRRYL